jgi:thiamine-monophosphate kinase
MDLSDGLMKDLGRMCRASGVGARVDQAALPLSIGFQTVRAIDPTAAQTALFGGDDYEVLAAVPPDRFEPFVQEGAAAGIPVARIGVFTALTDIQLVDPSGARIEIGASGWDHF